MGEQPVHQQALELAPTHQQRFAINLPKEKDLPWPTCEKDLKGKLSTHQAYEGSKYKLAGLERSEVMGQGVLCPMGRDNTRGGEGCCWPRRCQGSGVLGGYVAVPWSGQQPPGKPSVGE